jgi:hypothetical protein
VAADRPARHRDADHAVSCRLFREGAETTDMMAVMGYGTTNVLFAGFADSIIQGLGRNYGAKILTPIQNDRRV